jgi:hypothetical protein
MNSAASAPLSTPPMPLRDAPRARWPDASIAFEMAITLARAMGLTAL